jgi:hypothetical protein
MGSELKQESIGSENANRMYTEPEDQQILSKWWNKKLRSELARELGRSEAALAQRFYAILKKQGIDPKAYRANMKQQSTRRHLQPTSVLPGRVWTRDEDITLWRSARAGEDFATIAGCIPGRSIQECQERYESLCQANASTEVIEALDAKGTVVEHPIQEGELSTSPVSSDEGEAKSVKKNPRESSEEEPWGLTNKNGPKCPGPQLWLADTKRVHVLAGGAIRAGVYDLWFRALLLPVYHQW